MNRTRFRHRGSTRHSAKGVFVWGACVLALGIACLLLWRGAAQPKGLPSLAKSEVPVVAKSVAPIQQGQPASLKLEPVPPETHGVSAPQPSSPAPVPLVTVRSGTGTTSVEYVKDELLLKFNRGVSEEQIAGFLDKHQLKRITGKNDPLSKIGYAKVKTAADADIVGLVQKLQTNERLLVKTAEPNYTAKALADEMAADPFYAQQWYLQVTTNDVLWDNLRNTVPIIVAVVDTGVETAHPDLAGQCLTGYSFVADSVTAGDDNGHGTHVAGIIGAKWNNIGIRGLSPFARILPVQVLDQWGNGTYADVARGIIYAADQDARVINLSLGGYALSDTLQEATSYALAKGCILVAAAGNDGVEEPMYPAACRGIIAVNARSQDGKLWMNSNRGSHISVTAPGVDIVSTENGDYAARTGTSASAAIISALSACILAKETDLQPAEVLAGLTQFSVVPATVPMPTVADGIPYAVTGVTVQYSAYSPLDIIWYGGPVHQWIAFQAYNRLGKDGWTEMQVEMANYLSTDAASVYYADDTLLAPNSFLDSSWDTVVNDFGISSLALIEGTYEEDKDGHLSDNLSSHYWNPADAYNTGLNGMPSALQEAFTSENQSLATYQKAIDFYNSGNKAEAYYWLGRTAHLLADVGVPAHTLLDDHVDANGDSYERFTADNYRVITCDSPDAEMPAALADVPVAYNTVAGIKDYLEEVKLFYSLAMYSRQFDSDDVDGSSVEFGQGKYNNFHVLPISDSILETVYQPRLESRAIGYTAALYKLFWEHTHTVGTAAASAIGTTTATSGGNVTTDGGATVTARGVCWSTSANPTTADPHTTDGAGTGSFISALTSLTPGTPYHIRAYATNSAGTSYGSDLTFTTAVAVTTPTVTTTAASAIGTTTATSGGNVTADGGATVTARGVCWSTFANPTTVDPHTTDGTGTGSFISALTSLTPGTPYHIRAYATNSAGTSYGSDLTFTPFLPISSLRVTAFSRTGLTGYTVTLSATASLAATEYAVMEGAWNAANAVWQPITGGTATASSRTFTCTFDLQPTVGSHRVYLAVRNSDLGLTSTARSLSMTLTGPAVYWLKVNRTLGVTANLSITVTGSPKEFVIMEGAWVTPNPEDWKTIPDGTVSYGRLTFTADFAVAATAGTHTLTVAVRDPATPLTSAAKSTTVTLTAPSIYSLSSAGVAGTTVALRIRAKGTPNEYGVCDGPWNSDTATWQPIVGGTVGYSGLMTFAGQFTLGAIPGSHTVSVAVRNTLLNATSTAKSVTVTVVGPSVSSMTPSSGPAGSAIVTLSGRGLGLNEGGANVDFGGVSALIQTWSNTSVKCVVPATAPLGAVNVVLTTSAGLPALSRVFTVLPFWYGNWAGTFQDTADTTIGAGALEHGWMNGSTTALLDGSMSLRLGTSEILTGTVNASDGSIALTGIGRDGSDLTMTGTVTVDSLTGTLDWTGDDGSGSRDLALGRPGVAAGVVSGTYVATVEDQFDSRGLPPVPKAMLLAGSQAGGTVTLRDAVTGEVLTGPIVGDVFVVFSATRAIYGHITGVNSSGQVAAFEATYDWADAANFGWGEIDAGRSDGTAGVSRGTTLWNFNAVTAGGPVLLPATVLVGYSNAVTVTVSGLGGVQHITRGKVYHNPDGTGSAFVARETTLTLFGFWNSTVLDGGLEHQDPAVPFDSGDFTGTPR